MQAVWLGNKNLLLKNYTDTEQRVELKEKKYLHSLTTSWVPSGVVQLPVLLKIYDCQHFHHIFLEFSCQKQKPEFYSDYIYNHTISLGV